MHAPKAVLRCGQRGASGSTIESMGLRWRHGTLKNESVSVLDYSQHPHQMELFSELIRPPTLLRQTILRPNLLAKYRGNHKHPGYMNGPDASLVALLRAQ